MMNKEHLLQNRLNTFVSCYSLDNIEMILLRGDFNNAGLNITDFSMESAQHINVGLGAASLVEECTCPPGYDGLSCQVGIHQLLPIIHLTLQQNCRLLCF